MTNRALALIGFIALSLSTRTTMAQTTYTYNNTAGAWSDQTHWLSVPGGFPNSATSIALFNGSNTYNVDVDGTYDILALQFGASQTGTINVRAGSVGSTHLLRLNPGVGANGSILANDGKTTLFLAAGSGNQTIGTTPGNAAGLFLGGGSVGTPANHVWEIQGSTTLTVNGQISANPGTNNTLTKVGSGTLTLAASNAASQPWNGGLIVSQGAVVLNGGSAAAGTGPVTVNSGATLNGRGTINMPNASTFTTIKSGGTLSPGIGTGTAAALTITADAGNTGGLIMDATSILSIKLFGTGATDIGLVTVNGNATINTNKLTLDLNGISATTLRTATGGSPRTYTVLTASNNLGGSGFDSSGFMITNQGSFSPGEWSFGSFDMGVGAVTLNFTPVPETKSMLAIAAALLLAGYQLRKNIVLA